MRDEMVRNGKIAEMQFFAKGWFGISTAVIAGIIAICVVIRRKQLRAGDVLCLVVGAVLLFLLARFTPIFAMASIPLFAATMPRLRDEVLVKRSTVLVLAIVAIVGAVRLVRSFPRKDQTLTAWLTRHGPDVPSYPCKAADFVEQHVTPRTHHLINEFSWGGYLAWRLGDQYQILMDGRTQVYTPEFWHAAYLDGEDSRRRYLAGIEADAAILPAKKSAFHDALLAMKWRSAYTDDQAEVMLPPE
jgi:hypothetical protein